MCCGENEVFLLIYEILFLLGVTSPKYEYEMFFVCREQGNDIVGECFPADISV